MPSAIVTGVFVSKDILIGTIPGSYEINESHQRFSFMDLHIKF